MISFGFFSFLPLHGLPDFDFVWTLCCEPIRLPMLYGWGFRRPSYGRACLLILSLRTQFSSYTPYAVGRTMLMLASGLAGSSNLPILEARGLRSNDTCTMVKIVGYLPMVVVLAWRMLSAAACESATRRPGSLPLWGLGSVSYSDSAPAVKCFHSNPTRPQELSLRGRNLASFIFTRVPAIV